MTEELNPQDQTAAPVADAAQVPVPSASDSTAVESQRPDYPAGYVPPAVDPGVPGAADGSTAQTAPVYSGVDGSSGVALSDGATEGSTEGSTGDSGTELDEHPAHSLLDDIEGELAVMTGEIKDKVLALIAKIRGVL